MKMEYTFADAQEAVSCSLLHEVFETVDGTDLACCAFGRGICFAMCFGRDVSQLYPSLTCMCMYLSCP